MLGLLRQVQGWVKLKGDSDGTKIGNVGDRLKVVSASAEDITITPINIPLADTEVPYALANNTTGFILKCRSKVANVRISFVGGGTSDAGANQGKYLTIPEGGFLELRELNLSNKTLYLRSDKVNLDLELMAFS